ncbi:MAG: diguanylate cyclase [Acidobacteriota bacterium]|jgi:diguanylate cyclase (GGDEF)-like protein|nr:diguanylate cyclase [Acidobacteriota bacterium]
MKVLLADDDAFYRLSLKKSLCRWGYEVVLAADGAEAWDILQGEDPPRLVILDWMMPGMDGVELCRRIRGQMSDTYSYVILVTSKNQQEDVITALDAQADDYLGKPFDIQELRARLQSGLRIINLQSSLALKQRELCYQATHDSLTGIWNRQAILDLLARETAAARAARKPLSAALVDIDNFKRINDTFGYVIGDQVLQETVLTMQSALRHFDHIGRYDGEEFFIVMPGVRKGQGMKIAERVRRRVADRAFHSLLGQGGVTLSIGVASDSGGGDPGLLLRSVDEALYGAKARGRNRVDAAAPPPRERRKRQG